MTKSVVTVADTVLGYGSPQVLSVTKALAEYIGGDHRIYQPFVPQRRFIDLSKYGYFVETITSVEHPWTWIGRMQYLRRVAKAVNEVRPEVLILPNYNMLPIIDLLNYRPRSIIHIVLEDLEQFGESYWAQRIIHRIKKNVGSIDMWIFPERNRAIHDCYLLGIPYSRMCLLYNLSAAAYTARNSNECNGRIVYAGSVDFQRTVARFFSSASVASEKIDVFGTLSGTDKQKRKFLEASRSSKNNIRYFGEISAELLEMRLPYYAYSLVYWFPLNWALRNAAPNKFFQAIASGVPVIAAPHPQCVSVIKRYGCGIVLRDWKYRTFVSALKFAVQKIGTSEYQDMVSGCNEACRKELNWDHQFDKVVKCFERIRG
jgi:glycosyltransferase involved in cell wall biosynthesis